MADLRQERALFEACLAEPADQREAWLEANCADPALRERVARLVRTHEQAEARDALKTPVQAHLEERIGPYRLLERIGEGAMGEVFLAEQTEPVQRRVALKVIKPGMDSREVIARFELERQTLALMSHPRIAHILDAGTTASGRPYFAMEYVPGVPLTKYCDQHRLPIEERLTLFLQICDAVQHAHHKGVIHRDLKPSNLLVSEIDGAPRVKVIDFGIAKAVSPLHAPSRAHTMIGHLIGTPEYMSPEQAQLSPLDVDTRADVYSLGVVLHELLTGLLPFKSSGASATPAALVQELMTHDPSAPSARVQQDGAEPARQRSLSARQLAARLRGDLDWIVLKALEKDRNRRYGSPAEFAADIRRHLAHEPVLAGPPSAIYRAGKFISRHRLGVAMVSTAFAALALFGVFMTQQAREIAAQRDLARYQAQRAEASNEFMSLMLEEVGPNGQPLTPLQLVDRGVELLDKRYAADPHFQGRMLVQMARRYMDVGSTEKQAHVLARAAAIARDLHDYELLASVQCAQVQSELEAARNAEARQLMEQARANLARAPHAAVSARVDCLRARSDVALLSREFEGAIASLAEARRLLEDVDDTRGLQYNAVLTDLGGVYFRSARYRDALALNIDSALALERNGRGGTLAHATVMGNRATLLYRLGETLRAEAAGRETIERLKALRKDEPPSPAIALNYGATLLRLERTPEAVQWLTAARDQAHALGNENWAALATFQLGRARLQERRLDDAQALLDEARQRWSADPTANADRLSELERTRAELELARGRDEAAVDWIRSALGRYRYPQTMTAPGLSAALCVAARIEFRAERSAQALDYAQAAVKSAEAIARDARESSDVGEALLVLAAAQLAQGESASGLQALDRAAATLEASLGDQHRLTQTAQALRQDPGRVASLY